MCHSAAGHVWRQGPRLGLRDCSQSSQRSCERHDQTGLTGSARLSGHRCSGQGSGRSCVQWTLVFSTRCETDNTRPSTRGLRCKLNVVRIVRRAYFHNMAKAQARDGKIDDSEPLEAYTGPSAPIRHIPLPKTVHPNLKRGNPHHAKRLGTDIRQAVEAACAPGACHGEGLAGWLIERAKGNLGDKQIFAGLVMKVMPAYLHATGVGAKVTINLGFAAGRTVGGDLSVAACVTSAPQSISASTQTIDMVRDSNGDLLIEDQAAGAAAHQKDPPTPPKSAGRGGGAR